MISKIIHIADVHCRNLQRHKEYRVVFGRLYEQIKQIRDKDTVIVLAGDIVHSKTEMSPELISIVGEFLTQCAQLCPTIVIPGNHDCNLNNKHRLDALSPIVESLGLSSLYYIKHSEVLVLNEVAFSHYSILDTKESWIRAETIQTPYKIALYHGPVIDARTEIGFQVTSGRVEVSDFDGFDLALLGDIHKRQSLQEYNKELQLPAVAYPGSLIQQNHGEDLDKGILVWDLATRTSTYVPVPNDHAYFTLYAKDNKLVNKIPPNIKDVTLRIKYENCDKSYLNQLQSRYKTKYGLGEILLQSQGKVQVDDLHHSIEDICNVRDIERQNQLIAGFVGAHSHLDSVTTDKLFEINRQVNSILNEEAAPVRNVIWKPLTFEFSNMFSYGENNFIDFRDYHGIYGVFAPNASGKSTLMDAIMYCLFDECSRTSRALHVLNNNSKQFSAKLTFELGGLVYEVERKGKKGYNNNVKVNVDFFRYESNGDKVSLNGEDRNGTNKAIRDIIGSYEDFTLTSISTQADNQNFINRSQKDRKELLYRFLDINIFEDLVRVGKEIVKEKQSQAKYLENKGLADELTNLNNSIQSETAKSKQLKANVTEYQYKCTQINSELTNLKAQLQTENHELNLDKITADLKLAEKELTQTLEEAKQLVEKRKNLEDKLQEINVKLKDDRSVEELKQRTKELAATIKSTEKQKAQLDQQRYKVEKDITTLQELSHFAENHEYDPNCKYCVSNPLLGESKKALDKLPLLHNEHEQYRTNIKVLEQDLISYERQLEKVDEVLVLKTSQQDLVKSIGNLEDKLESLKVVAQYKKQQVEDGYALVRKYEAFKEVFENNKNIKRNIESLEKQLKAQELTTQQEQLKLTACEKQILLLHHSQESVMESIKELDGLYKEVEAYDLYLKAVGRDGIPYTLLNQVLPLLQAEVNEILTQIVDFTVILECTDSNSIMVHINYGTDHTWPAELASGMERFILSLAIRSALVNITTLPRPNFLAIDEGFGALDSDKINNLYLLFGYLKTHYTFIICISHLDAMRDLTDKHITITKEDGRSRVTG